MLLPSFFSIFALLSRGCFEYEFDARPRPCHGSVTLICLCTSSERSSNPFLPQWRFIFPNLFSCCLLFYHFILKTLKISNPKYTHVEFIGNIQQLYTNLRTIMYQQIQIFRSEEIQKHTSFQEHLRLAMD